MPEKPRAQSAHPPATPSHRIDRQFPERFVDGLSRQEVFNKHLFRPNTYLHKWWARRCGSTFRTILKQFAPCDDRTDYYTPGGLEGLTVLDPMMGGGTTLHEAIRLGANVVGADIDPIPVLQARASLSRTPLSALRTAFDGFLDDLQADLQPHFQTHCPICEAETDIRHCLHGVRKRCGCGEVVQVEQYALRQEDRTTIRLDPASGEIYAGVRPRERVPGARHLIQKRDKQCPVCGETYQELRHLPFHARHAPVAVVGECARHGLFHRVPSQRDLGVIAAADRTRAKLDFGATEDFLVRAGPKSADLIRHNVKSYLDVFSSRQLLYLHSAITYLRRHPEPERLNLAMLVSTSLEFNSMLCGYKAGTSAARAPSATRSRCMRIRFNTPCWRTTRSTQSSRPGTCDNSSMTALNAGDAGPRRPWNAGAARMAAANGCQSSARRMPATRCVRNPTYRAKAADSG